MTKDELELRDHLCIVTGVMESLASMQGRVVSAGSIREAETAAQDGAVDAEAGAGRIG